MISFLFRLESIAKQVNINLVKVVAKSFDLSIPVDMVQKCPGNFLVFECHLEFVMNAYRMFSTNLLGL